MRKEELETKYEMFFEIWIGWCHRVTFNWGCGIIHHRWSPKYISHTHSTRPFIRIVYIHIQIAAVYFTFFFSFLFFSSIDIRLMWIMCTAHCTIGSLFGGPIRENYYFYSLQDFQVIFSTVQHSAHRNISYKLNISLVRVLAASVCVSDMFSGLCDSSDKRPDDTYRKHPLTKLTNRKKKKIYILMCCLYVVYEFIFTDFLYVIRRNVKHDDDDGEHRHTSHIRHHTWH